MLTAVKYLVLRKEINSVNKDAMQKKECHCKMESEKYNVLVSHPDSSPAVQNHLKKKFLKITTDVIHFAQRWKIKRMSRIFPVSLLQAIWLWRCQDVEDFLWVVHCANGTAGNLPSLDLGHC